VTPESLDELLDLWNAWLWLYYAIEEAAR